MQADYAHQPSRMSGWGAEVGAAGEPEPRAPGPLWGRLDREAGLSPRCQPGKGTQARFPRR